MAYVRKQKNGGRVYRLIGCSLATHSITLLPPLSIETRCPGGVIAQLRFRIGYNIAKHRGKGARLAGRVARMRFAKRAVNDRFGSNGRRKGHTVGFLLNRHEARPD